MTSHSDDDPAGPQATAPPAVPGIDVPAGSLPKGRRARRPRWFVMLLFMLAASVVLLEVVMQVGAYVVWLKDRKPVPEIPPGQDVVLCVGDSWTHGMGSSDPMRHSYPANLQPLLRERTARQWIVVNGGQSGQNSRDVLQRLPSQITEFRPRVLCVLVGQNDFWSVPEELAEGEGTSAVDHSAYRFRWRIPRLVAWASGRIRQVEKVTVVAPLARGPEWASRTLPDFLPYKNEPNKFPVNQAAIVHQREGWRLDAAKDVEGALRQFELAFAACPDEPQTRHMLAGLYRRAGRNGEVAQHMQWLADGWSRDGDYWVGRNLVMALDSCGRNQEALATAGQILARFPKDAQLWRYRAQSEFLLGRHEDAKRSIETSIGLAPDPWAYFVRHKVYSRGLGDIDEAVRSIYQGYAVFNDAGRAADDLRGMSNARHGPRFRPVLDALPCAADAKARLGVIVDEVLAAEDGANATRILSAHLGRIAIAAHNAGATPVFLAYPTEVPAEKVLRSVAAELDVPFIDVRQRFVQKLGARPLAEVRAPDGHCNDDGYRIMAEAIAEGLQEIVGATGR